ncbi:MAG: hypothetical protein JO033_10055 [Acidobacteriaceae bacterium]|nr:hypothetical protein [Acidobacteriaceae bacterium]MBV9499762.1 hypothetical protein [Acidobacteriaceae bacterium]
MSDSTLPATVASVPCCPQLETCNCCDRLDFRYRLPFRPTVNVDNRTQIVPVEVTLVFTFERCPGSMSLGDLLYSNSLMPGETVRLFSSDRHSRFYYDSETQLSSRQQTTSEESYFMSSFANSLSQLNLLDQSAQNSSYHSSSVGGGGGAGLDLGFFSIGGSVSASSYDANAASTFAHSLSQFAASSSSQVQAGTHAAASTSIGEVATRAHSSGESEDQYESSSRTFSNPNHCHAVTFFFYRINKCQKVSFTLSAIERRVIDPAAPTGALLNPPAPDTGVSVIPYAVTGTNSQRLAAEERGRTSVTETNNFTAAGTNIAALGLRSAAFTITSEPLPVALRKAALAAVDADLEQEGLLDNNGNLNPDAVKQFSWQKDICLPTPGVLVKGCLDTCSICEPEVEQKIQLELQRMDLENKLLQKKIDLLDKAQEYRCCPGSSSTQAQS